MGGSGQASYFRLQTSIYDRSDVPAGPKTRATRAFWALRARPRYYTARFARLRYDKAP